LNKKQQAKRTQRYTNEFKSKAVQLSLLDGVKVCDVAKSLDIHPFMLSRWRKEQREGVIKVDKRKKLISLKRDKSELDKVKSLEKENARLKQENDLLKKWQRFLGEERQKNSALSIDAEAY